MADENNASFPQSRDGGAGRGDRSGSPREGQSRRDGGGQRDASGFRIRLSDNELRAVRAIQDAFQLRSTVAALGFSVRTLAQMLEEGKLDALVAEQRAQGGARPEARRDGRRGEGRPDGRPERAGGGGGRVNPFARPQKPAAAAVTSAEAEPEAAEPIDEAVAAIDTDAAEPIAEAGDSAAAEA